MGGLPKEPLLRATHRPRMTDESLQQLLPSREHQAEPSRKPWPSGCAWTCNRREGWRSMRRPMPDPEGDPQ
jgi:hypothetical protein